VGFWVTDRYFSLRQNAFDIKVGDFTWQFLPDTYLALAFVLAGFFVAARLRALAAGFAVFTDFLEGALAGAGATSSRLSSNSST
jgi:hypothetical protein